MADPLSITALGITVCQGCVTVLSAWRSFDKDLNSALQAIEDLLGTLMVLKPLIDGSTSSASPEAINLKDKIRGCEEGVRFLENLLEKVKGQHLPGNQSRKAWKKMQHFIHPLKKGSLNELKDNVGKSHHGLAVALQVYQLAIESVDSASTSTKLSGIETRIDELPRTLRVAETSTLLSQLRDSTAAIPRDVENTFSQQTANLATATELARLQDNVQALPETLHIRENSSILSDIRDSTTTIPRMIENVVIQQTASLATSTAINNLQNDVRLLPQSLNATENMAMLSDIRDTVTAIPQTTGDIVMQYLEGRLVEMFDQKINELAICHQAKTLEHGRSCGFTFPPPSLVEENLNRPISSNQYSAMSRARNPVYVNHRTSNYGKQHKRSRAKQTDTQPSFYICFLGAFTRLCITASHGAGGHSIARMLSLRGFVCLESKAFKVIDDYTYRDFQTKFGSFESGKPYPKSAEQWCYVVKTATEEVRRLLATGEASPVSVNNRGDTLMHRSIYWITNTVLRETSSEKSWDLIETCLDLIKTLLDLGVPENEVNLDQVSPLSAISWWSEINNHFASKIQLQLRNIGFDMVGCISEFFYMYYGVYQPRGIYPGNPTPVQMLNIMRSNPDILEATKCGPLSEAVLNRAGHEVRGILKRRPEAVNESNLMGQSPLHLSVDWPEGVSLLLKHGANPNLERHDTDSFVLWDACFSDCVESVRKLLEYGAYSLELDLLLALSYASNKEIIDLLISTLVKRRNELSTLAKEVLPPETISKLLGMNILDTGAYEVYKEVNDSILSVDLPPIEYFFVANSNSILHYKYDLLVPIEILDKLWNAGFRDIDEYDERGRTPLMCYHYSVFSSRDCDRVCWAIDKGASLPRIHRTGFGSGFHYLSNLLVKGYCDPYYDHEVTLKAVRKVLETLRSKAGPNATIAVVDNCDCRCSIMGCSMYSMFTKLGLEACFVDNNSEDNSEDDISIDAYYPGLEFLEELVGPDVKQCFRPLIFGALGLKHTCCKWHSLDRVFHQQHDHEEIEEINSEQAEAYELLDRLIELAEKKWSTESRPFLEFWLEFKQEEILDHKDSPIPGYAERLREIGVRLEGESTL